MSSPAEMSGDGTARLHPRRLKDRFLANGGVGSIALFFLFVVVLFSVTTEDFLTLGNILNILRQSAPLLMVAAPMTLVITTGGIDLSVGSILALVSALSAILIQAGVPWAAVVLLMLGCGALIGAIQGFFVAFENIPSFIVTLAGLSVVRGIALLATGGYSIPIPSSLAFVDLGRGWFLGVPMPALIAAAVTGIAFVIFNETPFGRYVTGIGANREAVRRAGVNTRVTMMFVYVLSGTMAALAGLVLAARLGSGSSNAGQGFELDVIAAVVLGGTSLFGGRGTMIGTVLGALTVAVIGNGLILSHLSPFLTPIVTGMIILIAIWMNVRLFRGAGRKGLGDIMADPSDRIPIGVSSGTVMSVLGPIPVDRMGVTLMHEHILLDASKLWQCPCSASDMALAEQPVTVENIGELRMNPFLSRDNCFLLDVNLAVGELGRFSELGGDTVVDPTNFGIGRDPAALQRISRRSRLNIVMGSGFYLEPSHPTWFTAMDLDEATAFIVNDVGGGPQQPEVMAGIIGEIGVSKSFTAAERKSLRAAARASRLTGVPLSIHLPGWERLAHSVLDIVEEEGADLAHTVLCHMNPSGHDLGYQTALAARGAFLEYDMIGMDFYYADQDAQSPSDEENARAIRALIDKGFSDRLLISQDVFLKIMLTKFGGFGYGYILKHFVPRLKRHGIDQAAIDLLLRQNPVRVFAAA